MLRADFGSERSGTRGDVGVSGEFHRGDALVGFPEFVAPSPANHAKHLRAVWSERAEVQAIERVDVGTRRDGLGDPSESRLERQRRRLAVQGKHLEESLRGVRGVPLGVVRGCVGVRDAPVEAVTDSVLFVGRDRVGHVLGDEIFGREHLIDLVVEGIRVGVVVSLGAGGGCGAEPLEEPFALALAEPAPDAVAGQRVRGLDRVGLRGGRVLSRARGPLVSRARRTRRHLPVPLQLLDILLELGHVVLVEVHHHNLGIALLGFGGWVRVRSLGRGAEFLGQRRLGFRHTFQHRGFNLSLVRRRRGSRRRRRRHG